MKYRNSLNAGFGKSFGPHSKNLPFTLQFLKPGSIPKDFKKECCAAAAILATEAEDLKKPVLLALSGGLDSQIMALSFLAAKVPFECFTFEFNSRSNRHDVFAATKFCQINNIPHRLIPFDLRNFFESGDFIRVADQFGCRSPLHAVHLSFMLKLAKENFIVFSGSVARFRPLSEVKELHPDFSMKFYIDDYFKLAEAITDKEFCWDFHGPEELKSSVATNFFQTTPELILAGMTTVNPIDTQFLYDRTCRQLTTKDGIKPHEYFLNRKLLAAEKSFFARQAGFDIVKTGAKYTGFEIIQRRMSEPGRKGLHREISGLVNFNAQFRKPLEEKRPVPFHGVIKYDDYFHSYVEFRLRDWLKSNLYKKSEILYEQGAVYEPV